MNEQRSVMLTFDIDMANYTSKKWNHFDELEMCFPIIQEMLEKYPSLKTTWFIRIDSQIQEIYGDPLYIFEKHSKKIEWLKYNNHEIGWHHHAYKFDNRNSKWIQNTDSELVSEELKRYGSLARNLGLNISRMGWGYHTNQTMKILEELNFKIDSSAIPRPQYKWDISAKDWSVTPQVPYFPSITDYRKPGIKTLDLLEVPINTTVISAQSDTEPNVIRYYNHAYKHEIFKKAVASNNQKNIVMISHPYEILPRFGPNQLLSFSKIDLQKNIEFLIKKDYVFKCISEVNK